MLNWVSMGFLISLYLWYNLIFVYRIQCFIPFCFARQKFFSFVRIQWLIPFCSFCFRAELSELNHSALFCFCAVSSDLYQIALLDERFCFPVEPSDLYQSADLEKSFSFSSGSSDLYHSALWGKSFSFSAGTSDLYLVALLQKTFFHGRFHLCIAFFFLFACSSFWLWDLCFAITFCLPAFDKLIEHHINLIKYSTSLLWNCFFTISSNDWKRKSMSFIFSNISSVPLGLNPRILNTFCFCFHIIELKK